MGLMANREYERDSLGCKCSLIYADVFVSPYGIFFQNAIAVSTSVLSLRGPTGQIPKTESR
jgi:hypothetical protein